MIVLIFFLLNFQLKAPTTEFVERGGKRITLFPLGIEIYEEEIKIFANYAEFDPATRILFLRDSVKILRDKDTLYTNLAIYDLKTRKWEMPQNFFLVSSSKNRKKLIILGENSQYDLEKEILLLEEGEIKLKEKVRLLGKKIEIDNKNNFLYSYLATKIMNYGEQEKIINSLNCDTLFYDFKKDTGWAKGNVNYVDSFGEVKGEHASFVLEEEAVKEVTFIGKVFLSFCKENNKIELECKKIKFDFTNNDLKVAYGEEIVLGKTYFKKQ
ncbi:MAG: hypothetical protein ABIK77_04185 [candidate division WOR-3 bacterium]|uniref:Organic solvent tolerance-like N-terminal domain-containing protein n=1 Tax=candidate division WOR-3 bacterium TaxID=2052148 RepID=A0A7C4S2W3_UNCW3